MKRITSKLRKRKEPETKAVGRITNDTVAEHREEVLGQARKYIYPLRQSKHRLVKISITIFLVALIAFFTYCTLALYKFKTNSTFLYKVTQVIPFPIARSGTNFIAYENYLFEINHYIHYYRTQQNLDFNSEAGQQQLSEYKKRALDKVINDAYVKELAAAKGVTVSDREVEDELAIVRDQNRLGANDQEFQNVLKDFWNWSEKDFKRSLKMQLLREKVVATYDADTKKRAEAALGQVKAGTDFGVVAAAASEDPISKANKGEYGFVIEKTNRDIDPAVIDALFKLQPGQTSELIPTGYGIEIVKLIQTQPDGKVRAAHMVFNYKDINDYINDQKEQKKTRVYLRL